MNFTFPPSELQCHVTPVRITKGFTAGKRSRSKRAQRLADELAATTVVTTERKAAVTLASAYNWKEWTNAGD